jgi:hypothetical protein
MALGLQQAGDCREDALDLAQVGLVVAVRCRVAGKRIPPRSGIAPAAAVCPPLQHGLEHRALSIEMDYLIGQLQAGRTY